MRCFVIMPFGDSSSDPAWREHLDTLYEECIRPAVEAVRLPDNAAEYVKCVREDMVPGPAEVMVSVVRNLVLSEIAIAVLTGRNPNVFYELGVRHCVSDNTILIAQSEEDVPFDLRGQRLIFYTLDFSGRQNLRAAITQSVTQVITLPKRIDNAVRRFIFENERERKLTELEAQGRPPGYDFVNQLVQEFATLKKGFDDQRKELREVIEAITNSDRITVSQSDPSIAASPQNELTFLEGAWKSSNNSHLYGRMVNGILQMPYCYSGNARLHAHFFNFRRIGDYVFARFTWFDDDISGYASWKIDDNEHLSGGWWYDEDLRNLNLLEFTDAIHSAPGMNRFNLSKAPNMKFPRWAEQFFGVPS